MPETYQLHREALMKLFLGILATAEMFQTWAK